MEAKEGKFNITETIRRIKKAREEFLRASAHEREISSPLLTDWSHVAKIYELFCRAAGVVGCMTVIQRKMFVFIIQYLYAPKSLIGAIMPKGLRMEIVKVTKIKAKTVISRCATSTLSEYKIYTQFRNDVNRIFEEIVSELSELGVLKGEDRKELNI